MDYLRWDYADETTVRRMVGLFRGEVQYDNRMELKFTSISIFYYGMDRLPSL